jgi:hypothetical protein
MGMSMAVREVRPPQPRMDVETASYEKVVAGLPFIIAYALGTSAAGSEVLTVVRMIYTSRDWPEGAWPSGGG